MATNFTSYLRLAVDSRDVANADKDLRGMASSGDLAASATSKLGSVAKTAFGLIATGISAAKVVDYSNQWTDLNSRVLNATKSQTAAAEVMQSIATSSRTTYSSLQQTADAFLQNNMVLTELGYSTRQQIGFSEALNNSLVISGAKGQGAATALGALGRVMAEGTMKSQEFNLLMTYSSRTVQALADGLGVSTIELRKMVAAGEITGQKLFQALSSQIEVLTEEAEAMPATIGDAILQVDNSFLRLIGTINELSGASDTITNPILAIVDALNDFSEGLTASQVAYYIDAITVSATALASVLTAKLVYSYATAAAASVKAASVARLETAAYAEAAVMAAKSANDKNAAAVSGIKGEQALAAARLSSLRSVMSQIAAEQALEAVRYRAQITDMGRAMSVNRMAEIGRDRANVAAQIAAAEKAQLAVSASLTAAQNAQAASSSRLDAANKGLAASTAAMGIASRAAAVAMSALGGPMGVILIAASAFAIFRTAVDESDYAIKNIAGTMDDAISKFEQMTEAQRAWAELSLSNQIEKDRAAIEKLEKQLGRNVTVTDGLGRATTVWYEALSGDKAVEARAKIDELNESISESERRLAAFAEIAPAWMVNLGRAIDNFTSKNEEANEELVSLFDNFELITKVGGQLESLFRTDLFSFGDAKADAEDLFNSFDKMEKVGRQLDSLFGSDLFSFDGDKESTEIQKIISALQEEVIALEIGEVAYLAYKLALQGASEEEIRAAVAAKQRAQEIRKANKTVESESKGLSKAAEQAAERIDTAFASIWTNILNGSTDAFSGIVDGFKSMLAEMAHEAITKPIVLSIQQKLGAGGSDSGDNASGAASAIGAGGIWGAIAAAVVVGVGVHNKEQAAKFAEMTAEVRQSRQSTGTLLGYANEKSESIANSIEQLESISRDQLDVNRGMLSALISVRDGITGVAAGFARSLPNNQALQVATGNTSLVNSGKVSGESAVRNLLDSIGGGTPINNFVTGFLGALGDKVTKEIFKKSVKVTDSGISIVGSSMADIIEGSLIQSFNYADVETKKKVFGVTTSTKLKTTEESIGELFDRQITNVFLSAGEALGEAGKTFGIDIADFANRLVIDTQKISLKDLSAEEVTAELERFLSATMDQWAQTMIGNTGILEQYQQAGEGAFETMVRVASQTNYLVDAFDQINVALPLTGVAAIEFSQELAKMAGGFDALQQSLGTYYDRFFTEQEKQANLTARLTEATAGLIDALPKTRYEFRAIIEALDVTTESGSKAFAELIGLSGAIDQYITALEKQTTANINAANQLANAAFNQLQNAINSQRTGLQGLLDNASDAKTALDAAINAERARLSAISQGAIDALDAQKSSISAISSAQKAGLSEQKSFVQQSITEMTNLSKKLRDSVFSMEENTAENSLKNFYEAAGQISSAITGEFSGSLDRAIGILSGVDRGIFGSQLEAESEIARAQLKMIELADATDAQLSIEEQVLKNIESQIEASDRYAANAAAGVDRQIAAAQSALAAELAALDEMAAAAQSQLNALLGIDDGVLSLEEAFAAFEEAVEKGVGVHSQIQLLDELLNTAQSEYNLLTDVSGGINDLNTALENFAVSIRDANIAQGRQSEVHNQNLILELQALRAENKAIAASNAELQRIIANYTRTTAHELENQRRSGE